MTALEGGGLEPVRSGGGWHDLGGVAVRAEVRDDDVAVGVAQAPAGRARGDDRRTVLEDDAVRVGLVRRAQRVAVVVGGHLAEHVADVRREARHAGATGRRVCAAVAVLLAAGLVGGVDGRLVVEHPQPDGAERQREGLHRHGHVRRATVGDGEVRAIDLVPVGRHRDQVVAGRDAGERDPRREIGLVAVGEHRHVAGRVARRRPLAAVGVPRVAAVGRGRRPAPRRQAVVLAVVGVADVVTGDQPLVRRHGVAFVHEAGAGTDGAGARHREGDRPGARGMGRRRQVPVGWTHSHGEHHRQHGDEDDERPRYVSRHCSLPQPEADQRAQRHPDGAESGRS